MPTNEKPTPYRRPETTSAGYPAAQPPPNAAARPPPHNPQQDDDLAACCEGTCCLRHLTCIIFTFPLFYLTALVTLLSTLNVQNPNFRVESVSVSLNDNLKSDNSPITADWKLGFSVKNSNSVSIEFKDFNVWIMCMSQYWSETVVTSFSQGPKNTTFLNATTNTLLPLYNSPRSSPGLMLDFEVMFRVRDEYNVSSHANCKDMRVAFKPNAMKGDLVGGPVVCTHEIDS